MVMKTLLILQGAILISLSLTAQKTGGIKPTRDSMLRWHSVYSKSTNSSNRIFIVRHAEKQSGKDPLLTTEGNQRAGDLARRLKKENIEKIYVSEYKRTQHTADSLLLWYNIDTVQYIADTSCTDLFERITQHHDWNRRILIVSHSNIIPSIIYKLGITDFPQHNIPDAEFDNLYLITANKKGAVLKKMKYGKKSGKSATMQ